VPFHLRRQRRTIERREPSEYHTPDLSGDAMNWDQIEGNWKPPKGKAKEQWGKLTDDDFDVIAGEARPTRWKDGGAVWRREG
jgi:hypothetical protein